MNNTLKSCLLILPKSFYSFDKYIKETLTSMDFKVTVINDEYPEGIIGKIMGKLHIPLLLPITNRVITKNYLTEKKFDLVLIIKGRGMSVSLISKLKVASPKVIGYNFDSFKYNRAPLKWYNHVTKYYTFDYRDADNYSLPVVELFSSISNCSLNQTPEYEVSAILRNHSKRLNFIDCVLDIIKTKNLFIYIYEKNLFTFLLNFINNPFLYLKYKKFIYFKPLNYKKYIDVLIKSNFTIDYAHPKQSGITIRCFEALSTQTKIITNNTYVKRNSLFNDNNTIIFHGNGNSSTLKYNYERIFNSKIKKCQRTINDFINDLIL